MKPGRPPDSPPAGAGPGGCGRGAGAAAWPRVSVIVPARNEERYIGGCLSRLLGQDYPAQRLEILVVDCASEDRTREVVSALQREQSAPSPALRLLDDPGRERTTALNAGIRAAAGEVIMRVDARCVVPPDYVRRCVDALFGTGADNAGGMQHPIAASPMQEAIGAAMSHPFGVGDAQFRVGKKSGFVDTVYLGAFRRKVFETVGLFDELVPVLSEDSDINQRIRDRGGKVYLDTEIRVSYYPREHLRELLALYFRYGVARAGNVRKHRRLTAWRQAVPPLFVAGLALLAALASVQRAVLPALAAAAGAYAAADVGVSGLVSLDRRKWHLWPRLLAVFPCMHFAWAFGFLRGLVWPAPLGRGLPALHRWPAAASTARRRRSDPGRTRGEG
jgi:succinoglycan biosynthesis protein ExoA